MLGVFFFQAEDGIREAQESRGLGDVDKRQPSERLAVGVVVFDELIDALHKLLDAGERAATDGLVGDQGEEALDLIEPGVVGWDEAVSYTHLTLPTIYSV